MKRKQRTSSKLTARQISVDINELLEEINHEVSLLSHRLATSFLTDVFRSIFNIEKSVELIEPRQYSLDEDPSQILYNRLNPMQLANLPLFILNDEVLAKNYKLFSDIDFLVVTDLSLSMHYRWSLTRDISATRNPESWQVDGIKRGLRLTKLYALKYILCTFLYAAIENDFKINFMPFGGNGAIEVKTRGEWSFPAYAMSHIDQHFLDSYGQVVDNESYGEKSGLKDAILKALAAKRRSIVLLISDFLDDVEDLDILLTELEARHSLLVAVINDPFEKEIPMDTALRPLNRSWEHGKNLEENIRGRVTLSNEHIEAYNKKNRARRKRLFLALNHERISFLDIVTDRNDLIPGKLEELNLNILQGL